MNSNYTLHPNTVHATLVEDFVVTAQTMKAPYIRVTVDDHSTFKDTSDYPLALVPGSFFVYPLKKGDTVWLYSPSESPMSFVLHVVETSSAFPIPDSVISILKNGVTFPAAGQIVTFPATTPVVAVTFISKDFYILAMDGATQIVSGNTFTCYLADKIISYTRDVGSFAIKTGKYLLETGDLMQLKAKLGFLLESTNNFKISSNSVDLKNVVNQVFSALDDMYAKMNQIYTDVMASVIGTPTGPGTITVPGAAVSQPLITTAKTNLGLYKTGSVDVFFQET